MRLVPIFYLLLLGFGFPVVAQEASFLESIESSSRVTRGQAAELLGAAGIDVGEIDRRKEPIRGDELASVIAELGGLEANLGYVLFGSPRYAIRVAREENVYPDEPRRLAAGSPVDGETFLRLIRGPLVGALDRGEPATVSIPSHPLGVTAGGPWTEWDIVQLGTGELTDQEARAASTTTVTATAVLARWLELQTDLQGNYEVSDDGSDASDLLLREFALSAYRDPNDIGPAGRLAVGRLRNGAITADGSLVNLTLPSATVTLFGGYTGLVPDSLNGIPAITDDTLDSRERPIGDARFSPERIALSGSLVLPEVIGRQSPGITVTSLLDPEIFDEARDPDRLTLTEITAGLAGSLGIVTFYDLQAALQVGSYTAGAPGRTAGEEDRRYRGWSASGEVRHYPGGSSRRQVALGLRVASGGAEHEGTLGLAAGDGVHTGYLPLSATTPWLAYPGADTNVAAARIGYTERLSEKLRLELSGRGLSRLTTGSVGVAAVDQSGEDGLLLGYEAGAEFAIQPVQGVIIESNGSIFFPATREVGGAFPKGAEPVWSVALSVTAEL